VDGRDVPICQAFEFGKYLGHLNLVFKRENTSEIKNSNYHVLSTSGHPILLDENVKEDEEILRELKEWEANLAAKYNEVIGTLKNIKM
jgi:2',3'-cyclic-nucleotide 2'-phosphodiesterase (5'-nucleotidase family)